MLAGFIHLKRVRLDTTRQMVHQIYAYHDWNLAVITKAQQTSDILEMSIRTMAVFESIATSASWAVICTGSSRRRAGMRSAGAMQRATCG